MSLVAHERPIAAGERKEAEARLKQRDLADFQREIEAEVEAERERRARALALEAKERHEASRRRDVLEAEERRLKAVERAERAAREMVAAFRDTLANAREVAAGLEALGCRHRVNTPDLSRRLSERLSQLLGGITHLNRFGQIELHRGPTVTGSWADSEREAVKWMRELVG
jgi:hypothetical protein